jgi:hypothetical protein
MSEVSTWTAPESGWYEFGDGEPRKLSDKEVAAMLRGEDGGHPEAAAVELVPGLAPRCRCVLVAESGQ